MLTGLDALQRREIANRGRLLQYLTMAWNSAECGVALVAGFFTGSIALIGFGLDSAIEVTSSAAALWRLRRDPDEGRREVPPPLDLGPDRAGCQSSAQLLDAGAGFQKYQWQDGSGDRYFTAPGPGRFWVKAFDECGFPQIDTIK